MLYNVTRCFCNKICLVLRAQECDEALDAKSVMKGTLENSRLQFLIFSNLNHSSQTHASLVGVIIVAKRADNACRWVAMN